MVQLEPHQHVADVQLDTALARARARPALRVAPRRQEVPEAEHPGGVERVLVDHARPDAIQALKEPRDVAAEAQPLAAGLELLELRLPIAHVVEETPGSAEVELGIHEHQGRELLDILRLRRCDVPDLQRVKAPIRPHGVPEHSKVFVATQHVAGVLELLFAHLAVPVLVEVQTPTPQHAAETPAVSHRVEQHAPHGGAVALPEALHLRNGYCELFFLTLLLCEHAPKKALRPACMLDVAHHGQAVANEPVDVDPMREVHGLHDPQEPRPPWCGLVHEGLHNNLPMVQRPTCKLCTFHFILRSGPLLEHVRGSVGLRLWLRLLLAASELRDEVAWQGERLLPSPEKHKEILKLVVPKPALAGSVQPLINQLCVAREAHLTQAPAESGLGERRRGGCLSVALAVLSFGAGSHGLPSLGEREAAVAQICKQVEDVQHLRLRSLQRQQRR
mmetsp:Transcript_137076/g.347252  ORF Transcript_137076/g.347252 Transcript_137076/m.347252 type:complete len:447 (-) Transcript_137076:84-1424(-)